MGSRGPEVQFSPECLKKPELLVKILFQSRNIFDSWKRDRDRLSPFSTFSFFSSCLYFSCHSENTKERKKPKMHFCLFVAKEALNDAPRMSNWKQNYFQLKTMVHRRKSPSKNESPSFVASNLCISFFVALGQLMLFKFFPPPRFIGLSGHISHIWMCAVIQCISHMHDNHDEKRWWCI